MRAEVRPGASGLSWVWRVWHNSREVAFGVSPTEEDAREQAEIALAARSSKPAYHWEIERGGQER